MATAFIVRDKYKTELNIGGHQLLADETVEDGGHNEGPEPPEFLDASLASCTAITLRMYADRKGWPLEKVTVNVVHRKDETKTLFTREVQLEGPLSTEQRQRLLAIANACPVHKILSAPIEVETQLSNAPTVS